MLIYLGLGLVVGLILALTGAGGGILAVPLLVFGAGMSVAQAGPIGLLAVGIAAALGALLGFKSGLVRYRAALLIAVAGMALSPVGLWLAHRTDNRWLSILFALVLLFVAYKTSRRAAAGNEPAKWQADPNQPCMRSAVDGRFTWTASCARALALTGAVAGLLSGLLGVGGGFVIVPALRRYTNLPVQSALATSLTVIALVSATGVVSSAMTGAMSWTAGLPFSAGALVGMLGGRMIASRVAAAQLQNGFAAVSALVAFGMIAKAMH